MYRLSFCVVLGLVLTGCSGLGRSPDLSPRASLAPVASENLLARHVRPVPLPAPTLEITPEVQREIDRFSHRDSTFISAALEQREEHYDTMRQIFSDEGVPVELLNVAMIESGYRPDAKSSAGAVGMWQFLKSTGRLYGLQVGVFEDQRKDPVLSTIAAARHLRDLYLAYSDWNLALAAYNAGAGGVDRAINRAGTTDFWELSRSGKLRLQTRQYVARFVAVTLMMQTPEKYLGKRPEQILARAATVSANT